MDLYTAFFRTNPQTRNAGRKLYLALGISLTPGRLPSTAPAETRFMTQKGIPPKSGLHDLLSFGFWAMKSICLMVKPQCLKSQCLILLKGEILQTRKVCRIFVGSLPPELFIRPVNGLGWSCGIHHTSASRSKLRPDTTVNGWNSGIQNLGKKKHAYKQFAEASPNKNAFNILEVYCFFMEELQVCKVS